MNFNKEDVYYKMWNELYKAKDSYGVDVLTEIYNYLTKVIEKKLKKTNIMTNQDAKWYKNSNLAIYKECFGITPFEKYPELESADGKVIDIPVTLPDYYYGYIFIIPKENIEKNISSPYSGDYKKYDKFMLTVRNGDFVLEKFNEETINSDEMAKNKKIELLKEENKKLLEKQKKLESDIEKKNNSMEIKTKEAELKKNRVELAKLKKAELEEQKDSKELETKGKEIKDLEKKIKELKKKLETNKLTEATFDETSELIKISEQIKKNENEQKNAEETREVESETDGGFLIEEKDIGGKIYLTFSVSEYLEKMRDNQQDKKKEEVKEVPVPPTVIESTQKYQLLEDKKNQVPPAVIKIVQQSSPVVTQQMLERQQKPNVVG